ncbi:unnamed protein product [Coregonus sp. 'balchen']|nr:unnamed protein product [Coregonus sp. 'balchen']
MRLLLELCENRVLLFRLREGPQGRVLLFRLREGPQGRVLLFRLREGPQGRVLLFRLREGPQGRWLPVMKNSADCTLDSLICHVLRTYMWPNILACFLVYHSIPCLRKMSATQLLAKCCG